MDFWKAVTRVGNALLTGGGSEFTNAQIRRHQRAVEEYDRLRDDIARCSSQFRAAKDRIQGQVRTSTRKLREAVRILHPVGRGRVRSIGASNAAASCTALLVKPNSVPAARNQAIYTGAPVSTGIAVGVASYAALWATVQALGHASTGTFMGSIYGAAASNAGWAWFGGGSLLTGGGGMAAGHLVLPGLASAIAVAVSATLSYREGSRIASLCLKIENVNAQNSAAVARWQSDFEIIRTLETKLRNESELLAKEITRASLKLLPFGLFSRIRRLLRYWTGGDYYTPEDLPVLERLDEVAARFVDTFR